MGEVFTCIGCDRYFRSRKGLELHWSHARRGNGRCTVMEITTKSRQSFSRDDLVRAVLGQQWVTAMEQHERLWLGFFYGEHVYSVGVFAPRPPFGDLPAPVDVVAQIGGGE